MEKLKGNDIIIGNMVNGEVYPFAASTTCDIELNCDVKEVSSPSSGAYRSYIPGRKMWTVRLGYLVNTSGFAVLNLKNIGNTYHIKCYVRNNPVIDQFEGDAVLTQARITATKGNLVTGSWVFQGSGNI